MTLDDVILLRGLSERDRAEIIRWSRRILVTVFLVATFSYLHTFFSSKFHGVTGEAKWIWKQGRIAADRPEAFFAVRDFDLPAQRDYVRIKVAGDPEYTLWLNGVEIGGSRDAQRGVLDVYDVTPLARDGRNRVVAALRAPRGAGGFLLALDISRSKENIVVTDRSWRVFDRWSDELLVRTPDNRSSEAARELGVPPFGRWNFLERESKAPHRLTRDVYYPLSANRIHTQLPETRSISGVMVRVPRNVEASVFEFGLVRGRARLERSGAGRRVVHMRYLNGLEELEEDGEITTLTFAQGESVVVDPVERTFRYLVVLEAAPKVLVVRDR